MKNSFKNYLWLCVVIILVVCGWWLVREANRHAKPSVQDVTLRLSWLPQSQFAGFYIAQEKGFYEQEGLKVNIVPGSFEQYAPELISSGAEEFGMSGGDEFLKARAAGMPIVAVAAMIQKNPFTFIARKDSGIKSPQDFVGHVVGIQPGRTTESIFKGLTSKLGIDSSKIRTVNVQFDMTPFFRNEVDVWPGYILNEPLVAREQGLDTVEIRPGEYGIPLYADIIFVSEKTTKERSELVRRFIRASFKGWEWTINHPSEAVDVMIRRYSNLKKDHELAMISETIQLIQSDDTAKHTLGWMDDQKWQEIITFFFEQGILTKKELGDFYTNKFLQ
jgi:ABC-type nitrate/sulfonate/bicarbonate transport system substrate-binding protein